MDWRLVPIVRTPNVAHLSVSLIVRNADRECLAESAGRGVGPVPPGHCVCSDCPVSGLDPAVPCAWSLLSVWKLVSVYA